MSQNVIRRLLLVIPLMLGVYTVVFALIRIAPGDPVLALVEEGVVSAEQIELLRHEYGLDQPIYVQYADTLKRLLVMDLGTSFHTGQRVVDMVKEALPFSIQLTLAAMTIAAVVGIMTGIAAAIKHNSWLDTLLMILATGGIAAPDFWLGLMLVFVFVLVLGWFPLTEVSFNWKVVILPAITLAVRPMASIARLTRASVLEVLAEPYVITARSKGLSENAIRFRHVLRNSMVPVVTIMGVDLAATLSNAMVIEVVFARPGLGRLVLTSIYHKDFPAVQSSVMLISMAYVLANLLVDVCYVYLDPRLRETA